MENAKKYINVAIVEFSRLQFSGAALIPAGKVMQALCHAAEEVDRLMQEQKHSESEEAENDKG